MNFERTLTTDISSDFMQSKVGLGVPLTITLFVTDRAPKGSPVNGHFNKLKRLSYTLDGGHAIYTMACSSNAAATIGSWLSSSVLIRRYLLTWRSRYIYHGLQFECCCYYRQLVILISTHQTILAHMEKELLRMISHKGRLVAKIA